MPFGSEISYTPGLSRIERAYIRVIGAPILGLRIRARAILPLLKELGTPKRIADAGSGRGMLTLACARSFPRSQVIGLDLNEKQNQVNGEIMQRLGIGNIEFVSLDVLQINTLGEFDAILTMDTLEHLEDDLGCARVFCQSLNPGGFLIVHVPHLTRNLFGWHRTNWMDIEGHVRPGYTRESLVRLLTSSGFEVVHCGYNYNSVETLANDLSYVITGGRERHKMIYALAFPILLALAGLGGLYHASGDGSGLIALARRPMS